MREFNRGKFQEKEYCVRMSPKTGYPERGYRENVLFAGKRPKIRMACARFFLAGLMAVLLFLAVLFFLPGRPASAKNTSNAEYRILSVRIEEGDSLWKIASSYYSEDFRSIPDYIAEIKRMNGMSGNTLYAGGYLLIPYYSED